MTRLPCAEDLTERVSRTQLVPASSPRPSASSGRAGGIIRPSDIWFALGLLAAAAAAAVLLWSQPQGTTVTFRRDGETLAVMSLSQDAVFRVEGTYTNVFEIQDGQVRVIETDCPNGACLEAGPLSAAGAAIICAPNHVSATIDAGAETSGGPDALSG